MDFLLDLSRWRSLLYRYVDGRLFALAETLAHLIEQRPNLLLKTAEDLVPLNGEGHTETERHELREVAHSVLIFSADDTLLLKGSDVGPRPPLAAVALERIRPGEPLFETVQHADGTPAHRVSIPIPRHGDVHTEDES